jgi:hypothetical protein
MSERNFKKIGKFEFSVEVPMDSDLMVAITLAEEKRNTTLEEFSNFIKLGATREDKEKIFITMESILVMNENIKVMKDAAIAVRMYKLEQENNKKE